MSEASDRLRVYASQSGEHSYLMENASDALARDIMEVLKEPDAIQEANNRLSEIYSKRGETITAMRQLLDQTS